MPHMAVARSLGYSRVAAWLKVIAPQVYRQVRLPIFAVVAFSLSVVDVALIVGPANPPPLAVLAMRGFTDADVAPYFPAAAAAVLLLALVVVVLGAWTVVERLVQRLGTALARGGARDGASRAVAAAPPRRSRALGLLAARLHRCRWSCGRWRRNGAFPMRCRRPGMRCNGRGACPRSRSPC